MVLCNNITEADENFIENNMELFYSDCEVCEGQGVIKNETCEDCNGEGQNDLEAYQYYLADLREWDKARLEGFGVKVGYSELLDLHVIPIYDFGTSWDAFSYSKEVEDNYEVYAGGLETLERQTVY